MRTAVQFPLIRLAAFVGIGIGLSGCVAYPTVEKIENDFGGYLAKEYSIDYPSAALRSKLNEVSLRPKSGFREIKMKVIYRNTGVGEQTPKVTPYEVQYTNLENGFYRQVREVKNNGFLTARFVALTWAGFFNLKADTIISGDKFPVATLELKDVDPFKFQPQVMKTGDKLNYKVKYGNRPQSFNFGSETTNCIADKIAPASALNKNISGNAIWMECTMHGDNGRESKRRSAYLIDYALVLPIEFKSSTTTQEYELADFVAM